MFKPSTKVYQRQILEGYAIPAIIHNHNYFLVNLHVYENGRVFCWNFEDFEYFVNDVKRGWVMPGLPSGQDISIHGLGNWTIANAEWHFNQENFISYITSIIIYKFSKKIVNGIAIQDSGRGTIYKEVHKFPGIPSPQKIDGDSMDLFHEPTSIEVCRDAYNIYVADPSVKNKEKLKAAYESVPIHQRMYVGDMDTKDTAVRMILYGEQEIENWSHYRLAKQLGKELPSIKIPTPKEEKNQSNDNNQ